MRVLVLGANGLFGSSVVSAARDRGWSVAGTYRSDPPALEVDLYQLDIRDAARFESLVGRMRPDAVVNGAAMTDVDACQADPEQAFAVNGRAPGALASTCSEHDATFCHVSTDYVFDGEASGPYPEDAEPSPLQAYGESKLRGERAVFEAAHDAIVVRPSFVYGNHGASGALTGFPAWVSKRLLAGSVTPLFRDQSVTPTRSGQAAATVLQLLDVDATGTFHIASRSCVTPFEFGTAVCRRMDADSSLLRPSTMESVERPAPRPRYSCLDVSKVEAVLERAQPVLEQDLDAIDDALIAD